jgi:hypothetical protein
MPHKKPTFQDALDYVKAELDQMETLVQNAVTRKDWLNVGLYGVHKLRLEVTHNHLKALL